MPQELKHLPPNTSYVRAFSGSSQECTSSRWNLLQASWCHWSKDNSMPTLNGEYAEEQTYLVDKTWISPLETHCWSVPWSGFVLWATYSVCLQDVPAGISNKVWLHYKFRKWGKKIFCMRQNNIFKFTGATCFMWRSQVREDWVLKTKCQLRDFLGRYVCTAFRIIIIFLHP